MKLLLVLILAGALQAQQAHVYKVDGSYYYAKEHGSKVILTFEKTDIKAGTVRVGDDVIGVFAGNEEHDLLGVWKK